MGSASVAAVEVFARCVAVELAPIRVNVIRAGFIDTPLLDRYGDNRQKIIDSYAKRMPLKRVGSAEEVAETAIYLMKDSYTTDVIIQIDSGAVL